MQINEFSDLEQASQSDERLTSIGSFLRKGDMSIVGPRPIAVHHYERDRAQGNVTRSLIKGGLLGLGHIHKGTPEMGNPVYEYEYINRYINSSSFSLLLLDLKIIGKGIKVMLKGKGL